MKKLTKFKLNENPKSTIYTQKLNSMIENINWGNNLKLSIKGGTGGIKKSFKGRHLQVNIPASKGVTATATQWAIVTEAPEYDDPTKDQYIVQKASVEANVWTGDGDDIVIERMLGYEGYATAAEDLRNWAPWYLVDSIVKIVQRWDESAVAQQWYLDMPVMYHGGETVSSIRFSEDNGYTQVVWQ